MLTYSDGTKDYAEHGPDGQYDGRWFGRYAYGGTNYFLSERGKRNAFAYVYSGGACEYNGAVCAPDDPRVLALTAQVAPVEVRPEAPAPHPPLAPEQSSDGSAGSFCPRKRWRPPWPPRCTPLLHAVAGGRAKQPNSSRTPKHVHALTCTGFFPVVVAREARTLLQPNNRRLVHTNGPVQAASLQSHRPARRLLSAATRGRAVCLRAHAAHRDAPPLPPSPPPSSPLAGLCSFAISFGLGRPRKPWPTCRCAWRCARTATNQVLRGTHGYSFTPGVYRSTHSVLQGCPLTLRLYRHGKTRSEKCAAVGRARLPLVLLPLERACG